MADPETSRFPYKERACMPGSPTTPGWPSARVGALGHIAFHYTDSVGTRDQFSIAAQWLACTFPCRRFADILADACARLGADVGRYSFIAVDLHHLLLAGLPAHLCENAPRVMIHWGVAGDWMKRFRTRSAGGLDRAAQTARKLSRTAGCAAGCGPPRPARRCHRSALCRSGTASMPARETGPNKAWS